MSFGQPGLEVWFPVMSPTVVHHSWSVLDKALEQNLGGTVVDTLGQKNEYLALVALALDCLPGEHWKLGAFTN